MSDSRSSDEEDIKDKFGKDSSSDEEEKKDKVDEMQKTEPVRQYANGLIQLNQKKSQRKKITR